MKTIGTAVAAAVLLWFASAGKAAEIVLSPLPADAAPPAAPAACAPCTTCGPCRSCGTGRLRAWLSYRPMHRTRCGECEGCCEGRWAPLYLYFLGHCKEHPCTTCGAAGCPSCGWSGRPLFGSPTGLGLFGD